MYLKQYKERYFLSHSKWEVVNLLFKFFIFSLRVTSSSCAKTRRACSWKASASAAANVAGNSKLHLLKMIRNTKNFLKFPKWCFPKCFGKLELHIHTSPYTLRPAVTMADNSKLHLLKMFRNTKHFAAIPKWCLFETPAFFRELHSHISFHFEPFCDNGG